MFLWIVTFLTFAALTVGAMYVILKLAELVSVFLEHGARPNEVIQGWAKPLMLTISLGHKEVADRLRDAGADRLDGLELTHKFAMQT